MTWTVPSWRPLRGRNPIWWRLIGVVHAARASAVAGVLWYVLLWGLGALSFPVPDPPWSVTWCQCPSC